MSIRIALVMGSGGPQGSLWMRIILEELSEAIGFRTRHAEKIVGTSAGAVIGSEADDHQRPSQAVAAALHDLARPLPDLRPNAGAYWLRRFAGRALGVLAFGGRHDPRSWVRTSPRHEGLHTVTTTSTGARRVARPLGPHGIDEIAASAAVPFWNTPVRINGERLADGAIWSATNADLVDPSEFDLLVLFAPHVTLEARTLSFTGLHRVQLARELKRWRASDKPCLWFIPPLDSYKQRHNAERVRLDAKAIAAATLSG